MNKKHQKTSVPQDNNKEFVILMVLLMSLVALSIDTMLPALGHMSDDLNVTDENDIQLVISTIFLGLSFGLLVFGPLSDVYGRKNILYLGMAILLIGLVISIYSENMTIMLMGRFIQGIGVASCRVISLAMVRDKYEGIELARIISLIIAFFLFIPTVAPILGKGILLISDWRSIFWFLFVFVSICLTWLFFRQVETLPKLSRQTFSISKILSNFLLTLKNPLSCGYMLACGLLYGTFIGYLNSARQILEQQFMLGDKFVLYFGFIASSFAFSSYVNSYLVTRYKIHHICLIALTIMTLSSLLFSCLIYINNGLIHLNYFLLFLIIYFCCLGHLFANLNALALQPFSHMTGLATSVISSTQTFLGVFIGVIIGQSYDGTVFPLTFGFFICGFLSLIIFMNSAKKN